MLIIALTGGACEPRHDPAPRRDITIAAVWSGSEQQQFLKVLDRFTDQSGVDVIYEPLRATTFATDLNATIADGPPAVVMLPQPGLLRRLVECKVVLPLPQRVQETVRANYDERWKQLSSVNGTQYGAVFKVTNKSMIWYDARVFQKENITAPNTWKEFIDTAGRLADRGLAPVSVGARDGWVLTDWFENVYLQVAGPKNYDALAVHELRWNDPTVVATLEALAELWGRSELLVPNPLNTDFNRSVENVFALGEGVMVFEGDFVADRITTNGWAEVNETARFFTFPSMRPQPRTRTAIVAGDTAVMLDDSTDAQDLMRYLASPEAAEVWATAGGFISPIDNVTLESYPAGVARQSARALRQADVIRFDLSDQQPVQFGSTRNAGMYQSLQEFLRRPGAPERTARQLEAKADRVYTTASLQSCPGRG